MSDPTKMKKLAARRPPQTAPVPRLDQEAILEALKKVKDPEIGVNIVDLGLVYTVAVRES